MDQNTDADGQVNVLKASLENNINSFRNKRISNRNLAFRIKIAIVTIGALTTIILGLKSYISFNNSDAILSSIALVLSAIIPIFAAWEAFFDYRWLWVRYTATLASLYAIRDELDYGHAGGALTKEQLDALFGRMQKLLEEVDSEWTEKRFKDAKPGQTNT